jgi:uncharacterized membrane protein YkoI
MGLRHRAGACATVRHSLGKEHVMRLPAMILALLVSAVLPLRAQSGEDHERSITKKEMPKAVLAAFAEAYPQAKVKGYSKETENGSTEYEVESTDGKISRDVSYAEDGAVLAVEESMPYTDLPEAVRATITKEHPKGKVAGCERVIKGSTTHYEVVLRQGKKKTEIVYDATGAVVSTEADGKK